MNPGRPDARPSVRGPALLAALLVAAGCSPAPRPPEPEWPPPAGEEAYRAVLAEKALVDAGPRELAELAAADEERLDRVLDGIAGRIEPGAGWRPVFERLRADHPPDAEGVLGLYRVEVERARRFVERRQLVTLPEGRLEVVRTPEVLPQERYTFAAYIGKRLAVTVGRGPRLGDHCRTCVPPLAVHEAYPGHHTAFLLQHSAAAPPEPEVQTVMAQQFKNPFFHEGWGQYAEVLMIESGYYQGRPDRLLGAWRSLRFRVARARIDALLHLGDLTPEQAVEELSLFLHPETARHEVARHLAEPGAKAAYYVGLLQVLDLRETLRRRDPAFDLRAFHDELASLPVPVPETARLRFGLELGPGLPEGGLARFLPNPEGPGSIAP